MTQRTDEELAAAYLTGDEIAAMELVRRHSDPVGRYLFANGVRSSEIEDVVQEAFFRAFRALATWRREGSFRGWLFRIASNLTKDQYRREKGRQMVAIEDHDMVDPADPEGEAGANDLEDRIVTELAKLPRLQREVFLLRAQQGLDYDEIASALGTTAGAARVHYHHAVKRLKELVR